MFTEGFICILVVLQWCFRMFLSKKVYFCVQKSWQLPMQTQLDRCTLRIPSAHLLHTQQSHQNTLEIILKCPWKHMCSIVQIQLSVFRSHYSWHCQQCGPSAIISYIDQSFMAQLTLICSYVWCRTNIIEENTNFMTICCNDLEDRLAWKFRGTRQVTNKSPSGNHSGA